MVNLVGPNSVIDTAFQVSPNFLLDHLTRGAWHNAMGKIIPQYGSILDPRLPNGIFSSVFPVWKIVQNLQITANGMVEGLFRESGTFLNVRTGFFGNIDLRNPMKELNHQVGMGIDIGIDGFDANIYNIASDIRKLCMNASSIDCVYGHDICYFHVNVDRNKVSDNAVRKDLPLIRSVDMVTGDIANEIAPMRGFI